MTILYIDTIGEMSQLVLLSEEGTVAESEWHGLSTQTEMLLTEIDRLLSGAKVEKVELSGIAVRTSFGSYAGVRVGATTANLLAFSMNIPIAGVSSFDPLEIREKLKKPAHFENPALPEYQSEPFITKKKARL